MLKVGQIVNTHGIKGEIRVLVNTDFKDLRFEKNSKLYLTSNKSLTIESTRTHKKFLLVKFFEWNSINEAELYKDEWLYTDSIVHPTLDDGEFMYHQVIGLTVEDGEGNTIGSIASIINLPSNDVWVIKTENNEELLVPYIDDVVKSVDLKNRKVTIKMLEEF